MTKNKLDEIKYKQLTDQLDSTRSQIKNIIESTDVGTWEWNIQTGQMNFSQRWAQMIGYDLNDFGPVNAKVLEDITHPDDFSKSTLLIRQHLAGELPYYKYEIRVKHKNGHWVWVCERGCVISRDINGQPLIMFGTHTDISKRKQIEQSLGNYINILNHDLRSPLATIIGYSSFLLEDELSKEEVSKFAGIINTTGKKMLKMMESYLALAKIERGQDINKKKKLVSEIIGDIRKNFADLISGQKLIIDISDSKKKGSILEKNILMDEILFYSIISNLLHNALDATIDPIGEITLKIYQDQGLCLSFYNQGEIPKEVQKKLFKKFMSSKKNGTGMGLYSARLIARAHGGDVVYQAVSGGTIFALRIPLN